MFLYELQRCIFTYLSYLKFVKPLKLFKHEMVENTTEFLLIFLFLVSCVFSSIGQDGISIFGQCYFNHWPSVAITTALLHIIYDCTFLVIFFNHIGNLAATMTKQPKGITLTKNIGLVIAFLSFWGLAISLVNLNSWMVTMIILYNCSFTLVVLATGLPRYWKSKFKESGIKSKKKAVSKSLSKPTEKTPRDAEVPAK